MTAQAEQWGGVLAICGAIDKEQKPLLMASYNDDGCVRLFDLPSFQVRLKVPHAPWLSGAHLLGRTRCGRSLLGMHSCTTRGSVKLQRLRSLSKLSSIWECRRVKRCPGQDLSIAAL